MIRKIDINSIRKSDYKPDGIEVTVDFKDLSELDRSKDLAKRILKMRIKNRGWIDELGNHSKIPLILEKNVSKLSTGIYSCFLAVYKA
jgi:hypothetical protein